MNVNYETVQLIDFDTDRQISRPVIRELAGQYAETHDELIEANWWHSVLSYISSLANALSADFA